MSSSFSASLYAYLNAYISLSSITIVKANAISVSVSGRIFDAYAAGNSPLKEAKNS